MTDIHQLQDSGESAEEFLERLAQNAAGGKPTAAPGRRKSPAASRARKEHRRGATVVVLPGPSSQPWMPGSASLFVPGAGQWLNGQGAFGLLFLSLQLLGFAILYSLTQTWRSWTWLAGIFEIGEQQLAATLFFAGTLAPALILGSVMHAYLASMRRGRPAPFSGPAALPAAFSAIVPGWGQLLLGQPGKTAAFLTPWLASLYVVAVSLRWPLFWAAFDRTVRPLNGLDLTALQIGALTVGVLAWIVSAYDALLSGRR